MKEIISYILVAAFVFSCLSACKSLPEGSGAIPEANSALDIEELYPRESVVPLLSNLKWHGHIIGNENNPSPLTLLHFSDIHGDKERLNRVMTFYNLYHEYFDDIIHTGDAVLTCYENGMEWWDECGAGIVLNVCGNHDTWTGDKGAGGAKPWNTGYSSKAGFERYIKPYMGTWKIDGYLDNGMCWYKDYQSQRIRMIAVDNYHFNERVILKDGNMSDVYPSDNWPVDKGQQLEWFRAVLDDASAKGLSVICLAHAPYDVDPIPSSFMTLTPSHEKGLQTELIGAVQKFMDQGGEFITWLVGHNHQDWFGVIKGYPRQLLISIDTARDLRQDGTTWSNNTKPDGTKAMDCFNVFNVDPFNKYIILHRFGSEYDKFGRHIGELVYDYRNMQLIWNR